MMVRKIRRTINKIQYTNILENIIFKTCIFGIFLIVFVQISLCNNAVRSIIGSNNGNVIAMEISDINNPSGWVEIKIDKFHPERNLSILKNGEVKKDCIIEDDIIRIEVFNGDIIEIKALNNDENINVNIYDVSANIITPEKGKNFQGNKNIIYLFKTFINGPLK